MKRIRLVCFDKTAAALHLGQIRETIPLVQLCGYSSRILSFLGMGVHSPLLNMLPLRIPTWVPQDSVYLVTNIRVAQSRMPRPRYKETFSYFALLSMLVNAFKDPAESPNSHLSSSAMNSAGNDRMSLFNVSGLTL